MSVTMATSSIREPRVRGDSGAAARRVFVLAIWFGLVTGLLEVMLVAVKKYQLHRIVRVSPDVLWMAPLADIALFSLAGLLLVGLALRWPRLAGIGPAVALFAFLSFFTLALHYTPLHMVARALLAAGMAYQAGRWAGTHPSRVNALVARTLGWTGARTRAQAAHEFTAARHVVLGAAIVLIMLAGGVHARAWAAERSALAQLPAASAGRNIILIVWDTVRARSLSLYGYERPTSPRLDAFARDATVFGQAVSTAPWTLPSHASMFTGRWHHELSADWSTPLDRADPTLAEFLAERGYLTAGFVANTFYGSVEHGLNRGFDHYEDYRISPGQILISSALGNTIGCGIRNVAGCKLRRLIGYHELPGRKPAPHVNAAFLRWLEERDDARPFFAFLNYFDAHAPYLPPEPFATRFGRGSRGNPMHLDRADWKWTPAQARAEQDAYDGAIAYLDQQLGALLDELQRRGVLEETIVVLTSDHGEEFLEHGVMSHSNSAYMPALHVPLVIRSPDGMATGRIDAPVSVRDLPATLMDLLGIEQHPFPGESLMQLETASGGAACSATLPADECAVQWQHARSRPIHADLTGRSFRPAHYPVSRGNIRSMIGGSYHYIRGGDDREEVYDLSVDPWEERDLAGTSHGDSVRTRLRAELERSRRVTTTGGRE